LSILYYLGKAYDLTNEKSQKSLASISSFGQSISSLARKWFSREQDEFSFKTSGSTGEPKAIHHSRKILEASARITNEYFKLTSRDTSLLCLNPDKIGGAMMMIRSFIASMEIYAVDPVNLVGPLGTNVPACDFGSMVPTQLSKILMHDPDGNSLQGYKAILIGGAPLSTQLLEKVNRISTPVFETFGMTETVSHFGIKPLNGEKKSNYFEVIGDYKIEVNDEGCLKVKGETTGDLWITTTDLAKIVDEKHFAWLGRSDNIINSGGIKFSPEPIEAQIEPLINALGIQNQFVISSLKDESLGSKMVLLFEGQKLSADIENELMQAMTGKLDKYSIPKKIIYMDKFPITNNKVIRREITSILASQPHP